jgi:hypothetical protein
MPGDVETQFFKVLPPGLNGIVQVNVTTTAVVIDVTSIPPNPVAVSAPTQANTTRDPDQRNPIGKFIRVTVAGSNSISYAVGGTANYNALLNVNASSTSTVNATTGAVTVTGTECVAVPSPGFVDVYLSPGGTPITQNPPGANSPTRYIALVASSNAQLVSLYQSST